MKAFLIGAAAFAMCAGAAFADTRNLQGFTGVGAEGQFHVDVAVADHYSVEVTGPDADKIETRLEGNSLHINGRGWSFFAEPRFNATVHVTLPHIEAIKAARGAQVSVVGVNSDHVSIDAAMGGEIHVSGACQSLSAHAAMGGELDASALNCHNANVAAAMGGDAHVRASDALTAQAAMGGAVHVSGNPAQRTTQSTMGGDVSFN